MDLNELSKNPEQIKTLIGLLQSLLPANDIENKESVDKPNEELSPIKTRRKHNFTEHKNRFLDMPEKEMHKEDSYVDKKLSIAAPVARGRPFNPVKVTCRVCGKTEMVNPAIVYDMRENRYKCNTCSTSSG